MSKTKHKWGCCKRVADRLLTYAIVDCHYPLAPYLITMANLWQFRQKNVVIVTDKETKKCMDPWGKWSHLECCGRWGTRPARRGRKWAVGIRQWRRLEVFKMLEGMGSGLGTTPRHLYAQSTYPLCIMCNNLLYSRRGIIRARDIIRAENFRR